MQVRCKKGWLRGHKYVEARMRAGWQDGIVTTTATSSGSDNPNGHIGWDRQRGNDDCGDNGELVKVRTTRMMTMEDIQIVALDAEAFDGCFLSEMWARETKEFIELRINRYNH